MLGVLLIPPLHALPAHTRTLSLSLTLSQTPACFLQSGHGAATLLGSWAKGARAAAAMPRWQLLAPPQATVQATAAAVPLGCLPL